MEVKGSVKMEIRPIGCPLQNNTCIDCKYMDNTYLEEDREEGKLVATIFCKWEKNKNNKTMANLPKNFFSKVWTIDIYGKITALGPSRRLPNWDHLAGIPVSTIMHIDTF